MSDDHHRTAATHVDGTPIFSTSEDRAVEDRLRSVVAHAFGCEVLRFGSLSPIDCYACRDGRLIGVIEMKARNHEHGRFATVYLNVRKWLALTTAESGLGVPALYVIAWTDRVGWIDVSDVDARRFKIGGRTNHVRAPSDVEPLIEIPVAAFHLFGPT